MSNQNYSAGAVPVPSSFIEHLHKHGKSGLFLTGIIMFTVGIVISNIMFANVFFIIIPLAIAALPIIGFWLIFAAAKNPKQPEKTLTALVLFKVSMIISLVGIGLVVLGMLLIFIIMAAVLAVEFGGLPAVILLIAFLPAVAIIVLTIIFYYVPVFRILQSIKFNIMHNAFTRIRGVKPFTIFFFIIMAFGVVGGLIGLALIGTFDYFLDDFMNYLILEAPELRPYEHLIWDAWDGLVPSMAISTLFGIVSSVGSALCVVSLNKFANSMPR